jgi:hypothetical protein
MNNLKLLNFFDDEEIMSFNGKGIYVNDLSNLLSNELEIVIFFNYRTLKSFLDLELRNYLVNSGLKKFKKFKYKNIRISLKFIFKFMFLKFPKLNSSKHANFLYQLLNIFSTNVGFLTLKNFENFLSFLIYIKPNLEKKYDLTLFSFKYGTQFFLMSDVVVVKFLEISKNFLNFKKFSYLSHFFFFNKVFNYLLLFLYFKYQFFLYSFI